MSTELRNVPNTDLSQTRFYGGSERGTCVQVTSSDGKQFLQLTREQADQLSRELALFANAEEVVYNDEAVVDMDAFNDKYADVLLPVMKRLADR
jgi:hypothetical protein